MSSVPLFSGTPQSTQAFCLQSSIRDLPGTRNTCLTVKSDSKVHQKGGLKFLSKTPQPTGLPALTQPVHSALHTGLNTHYCCQIQLHFRETRDKRNQLLDFQWNLHQNILVPVWVTWLWLQRQENTQCFHSPESRAQAADLVTLQQAPAARI